MTSFTANGLRVEVSPYHSGKTYKVEIRDPKKLFLAYRKFIRTTDESLAIDRAVAFAKEVAPRRSH